MPKTLSPTDVQAFQARLCDVAEQLFAARGFDGVTLREMAEALGVSSMTPYRYFKDKDAILAAVRTRAFNDFAQAMETAAAHGKDAIAKSQAAGKAYQDFAFANAEAYRLMFMVREKGEAAKDPPLEQAAKRARATMSAHVAE